MAGTKSSSSSDSSDSSDSIRMPRATFKTRIDAASRSGSAVLTLDAGDLLLRASCTDDTFLQGLSLTGLSFGLEKPGSFSIDLDIASRSPTFHFSTAATLAARPLTLAYTHAQSDPSSTSLEAALAIDSRNKLACAYDFSSASGKIRYSYLHEDGTLLEPSFHAGTRSWDFSASRKITKNDCIKGTYKGLERSLCLDWTRSGGNPFKVYADIPLGDTSKPPKLMMEKIWSC